MIPELFIIARIYVFVALKNIRNKQNTMSWPRKPGNGAHLSRKGLEGTLKYQKKKKNTNSVAILNRIPENILCDVFRENINCERGVFGRKRSGGRSKRDGERERDEETRGARVAKENHGVCIFPDTGGKKRYARENVSRVFLTSF